MAETYTVVIEFQAAHAKRLDEYGHRVAIAKSASLSPLVTAWLVLVPRPRIDVSWTDVHGVYASTAPASLDASITPRAVLWKAEDQKTYEFDGVGFRPPSDADVPAGHYEVMNRGGEPGTFGLVQTALVNGGRIRSPVSGVKLPPGGIADFALVRNVYVWTLQDIAKSGTLVVKPADALLVTLSPQQCTARIQYEARCEKFVVLRQ